MDAIYPGTFSLAKVKWGAKFDYEFIENYKVLQNSFAKNGVKRHIDVSFNFKTHFAFHSAGGQARESQVPGQPRILLVVEKILRPELCGTAIQRS